MEYEGYREPQKYRRPHYYGDETRRLFVGGGALILLSLPLFIHTFSVSFFFPVFVIVCIGLIAGLENPLQKWTHYLSAAVALSGVLIFEWYALTLYMDPPHYDLHTVILFWINHALAADFFFAFYFSVKTIRGMTLK